MRNGATGNRTTMLAHNVRLKSNLRYVNQCKLVLSESETFNNQHSFVESMLSNVDHYKRLYVNLPERRIVYDGNRQPKRQHVEKKICLKLTLKTNNVQSTACTKCTKRIAFAHSMYVKQFVRRQKGLIDAFMLLTVAWTDLFECMLLCNNNKRLPALFKPLFSFV